MGRDLTLDETSCRFDSEVPGLSSPLDEDICIARWDWGGQLKDGGHINSVKDCLDLILILTWLVFV